MVQGVVGSSPISHPIYNPHANRDSNEPRFHEGFFMPNYQSTWLPALACRGNRPGQARVVQGVVGSRNAGTVPGRFSTRTVPFDYFLKEGVTTEKEHGLQAVSQSVAAGFSPRYMRRLKPAATICSVKIELRHSLLTLLLLFSALVLFFSVKHTFFRFLTAYLNSPLFFLFSRATDV